MPPIIRTCPTPGHAHPQYIESPFAEARFRVTAYASHEDRELGRPRSVTYHSRSGLALDAAAEADAPIVTVLRIWD